MTKPIQTYLAHLQKALQAGNATEHTYRPALKALLEGFASGITATNEPKRVECGAPDFQVSRATPHGPLTLGYVEAKDIGRSLEEIEKDAFRAAPATAEGRQLKRYLTLGNLLFTNYLDFRWYVEGERRATGNLPNPGKTGQLALAKGVGETVSELLTAFLAHRAEPVSKPKDLALRMARLTHFIRDIIIAAFEQRAASDMLRDLRKALAETLVPDLEEPAKTPEFADMFAQTLTYGLFAACCNHRGPGPFQRIGAALDIPKTNPFLRQLFEMVAGSALDNEPFAGFVDDLVQLLAHADIPEVLHNFGKRTRQEDPVLHFYETFLSAYDPAVREMRGVYYTPEPVVSCIVRSVDHLLRTRFSCPGGLGDTGMVEYQRVEGNGQETRKVKEKAPRVLILDPACGTGTFLYAIVDHIREQFMRRRDAGMWSGFVKEQLLPRLFGFELLMAPYAIAHFKLGMQLGANDLSEIQRATWAYDFSGGERVGIYLTNTLEEAVSHSEILLARWIAEEGNAAAAVKRDKPIMVVMGNPPYSGHSANKGPWIAGLINDYKKDCPELHKPAQAKWLQDDYVKFIRFGQWRVERTGQGILALITNHSYLDNPTFRGMRQQLMKAFSDIYIINLHGNSKKRERCPDGTKDENVFDIQQGVAISIFVKELGKTGPAKVHYLDLWGSRETKYALLFKHELADTKWQEINSREPLCLFVPQDTTLLAEYELGWKISEIMNLNGDPAPGIVTTQDEFAISWNRAEAITKVEALLATKSEQEARALFRLCSQSQWNYERAKRELNTTAWRQEIRPIYYRPFDIRWTVFDPNVAVHRRERVMHHMLAGKNIGLILPRRVETEGPWQHVLVTSHLLDHVAVSSKTVDSLFPLYVYDNVSSEKDSSNGGRNKGKRRGIGTASFVFEPQADYVARRANLNPAFLADMEKRLGLAFVADGRGDLRKTFGPEDVFYYIYAIFHCPTYRLRYAEFLKIDFPRVPLASDLKVFRALVQKGAELVSLHLLESPALQTPIARYSVTGDDLVERGYPRYLAPGELEPGTREPLKEGRVYISADKPGTDQKGQYFEGVPKEVWEFQVGGYQVCEKWLKDRRGRRLTYDDLTNYQKTVAALKETLRLMAEIEAAIPGWPLP